MNECNNLVQGCPILFVGLHLAGQFNSNQCCSRNQLTLGWDLSGLSHVMSWQRPKESWVQVKTDTWKGNVSDNVNMLFLG